MVNIEMMMHAVRNESMGSAIIFRHHSHETQNWSMIPESDRQLQHPVPVARIVIHVISTWNGKAFFAGRTWHLNVVFL